jgi:endoglucanase
MTEITGQGMNVIRLPVVPQTLNPNDPQGRDPYLKNHSSVRQTNARQAMEDFIRLADQNNIEVMLDIHSCSNYVGWRAGRLDARPPYVDNTRQGYDFLREDSSCSATGNPSTVTRVQAYNTTMWLNNLRELAGLEAALGVDNIIGIDIFNEPWDYTWAEWKSLTEQAYQAINSVSPHMLLFVQGISASAGNQDGTPTTKVEVPHGSLATNPNWGENLFEAGNSLPNVPRDRLVFSPHTYGPAVFQQSHFSDPAQPQCAELEGEEMAAARCNIVINASRLRPGWEEHFGYLRDMGYAIVVGEFGGNWDWPARASRADQQTWSYISPSLMVDGQWQNAFVDYMIDRGIQGCYWGMNPESGDTYGWYATSFDPVSASSNWGTWTGFEARKTNLLRRLWGF